MQVADSAENDANYVHAAVIEKWLEYGRLISAHQRLGRAGCRISSSGANVVYDRISIFPTGNGLAWDDSVTGTALTEDAVYLIDDIQYLRQRTETLKRNNTPAEFDGLTFMPNRRSGIRGRLSSHFADNTDGAAEGNMSFALRHRHQSIWRHCWRLANNG